MLHAARDLLKTVKALSEEKTFDYLVISTGISEPLPVAQTFVMVVDNDTDEGKQQKLQVAETAPQSLSHYAQLDTMVSVVDALNIFDVLGSIETLADDNFTGMVGNTGLATASAAASTQSPGGEPEKRKMIERSHSSCSTRLSLLTSSSSARFHPTGKGER